MKNPLVFFLSLIALVFIALGFVVHWSFIAIAVIIMIINQRNLMKSKIKKNI